MDAGGGFSVADLTGEPDEQGGFGLTVIRNLVDELVLDSTKGGGTRLKMIRRAGPTADGRCGVESTCIRSRVLRRMLVEFLARVSIQLSGGRVSYHIEDQLEQR